MLSPQMSAGLALSLSLVANQIAPSQEAPWLPRLKCQRPQPIAPSPLPPFRFNAWCLPFSSILYSLLTYPVYHLFAPKNVSSTRLGIFICFVLGTLKKYLLSE